MANRLKENDNKLNLSRHPEDQGISETIFISTLYAGIQYRMGAAGSPSGSGNGRPTGSLVRPITGGGSCLAHHSPSRYSPVALPSLRAPIICLSNDRLTCLSIHQLRVLNRSVPSDHFDFKFSKCEENCRCRMTGVKWTILSASPFS